MHIQDLVRFNSIGKELPPLMDSSPNNSELKSTIGDSSHVTCFNQNLIEDSQRIQNDNIIDSFESPILTSSYSYSSNPYDNNISSASWTQNLSHQSTQVVNSKSSDCFMVQEQSMLRMLIENHGTSTKTKFEKDQECDFDVDISSMIYNNEMFQVNQEYSIGHLDNGFLWNF